MVSLDDVTAKGIAPSTRVRQPVVVRQGWAYLGGLLIWLAFPPVSWSWLAWGVTIPWLRIIRQPETFGRRDYLRLYWAGVFHWALMVQWVRLPHWSAFFGWCALAIYLGVYLPLWIALCRWCHRRKHLPIWCIAPLVWAMLEWVRAYVLTGFSLGLLGHTQVKHPLLIQCADWGGAYVVGFLLVLTAAVLDHAWEARPWVSRWGPAAGTAVALIANLFYGQAQLQYWASPKSTSEPLDVLLVQGSIDTRFDSASVSSEAVKSAEGAEPIYEDAITQYLRLTHQAVDAESLPDLIIWPETIFPFFLGDAAPGAPMPPELGAVTADSQALLRSETEKAIQWLVSRFPTTWILGAGWNHIRGDGVLERYNSALHLDPTGHIVSRYDKMHPVMFGEYVPLGDQFPWLYTLTPMPGGLTAGKRPIVVEVEGTRFCPAICFENTVPQLIASQVRELDAQEARPDVLVTITNDGWFWGSSLLDLHLACGIFRTLEHRCAGLIAANTGFSAWVDPAGQVQAVGPRRKTGVLRVQLPEYAPGMSCYRRYGDLFCGTCSGIVLVLAVWGGVARSDQRFI